MDSRPRFGLRAPVMLLLATLVGCAATPADEEDATTSASALEETWRRATPTVFEIEGPIDTRFTRPEDWSRLEVADPLDPSGGWRRANTVASPRINERPAAGSTIRDQLDHGLGGGACRLRVNPFREEVGFRCKWRF
ncbi:MAG: hypothetical protein JST00_31375 [Deltaproteobacteria bacterium]|nr:hypothetical protein [Deltaproteobacteria bacterium]